MYLPYNEEVVNTSEIINKDNFLYPNFVGYLSPTGEVLDYSLPFGRGGHDINFSTELFKKFFITRYESFKFYGRKIFTKKRNDTDEKWKMSELKDELNQRLESNIRYRKKMYTSWKRDEWNAFDLALFEFFSNCYSNELFSESYGKNTTIMDKQLYASKEYSKSLARKILNTEFPPKNEDESDYDYECRIPLYLTLDCQYRRYSDSMYLNFMKETYIQYMGYHGVERTKKTITTSSLNVYETFYNYLLNDFKIVRLPKMIFDEKRKNILSILLIIFIYLTKNKN